MDAFLIWYLTLRNRYFLIFDLIILALTPFIAYLLRMDGLTEFTAFRQSLLVVTLVFIAIKITIFYAGGLYTRYWRYASIDELLQITKLAMLALIAQTLVFFLVLRPTNLVSNDFPRLVPVMEGLIALMAVGGLRYSVRAAERLQQQRMLENRQHTAVVVAGAGDAGVKIVTEMLNYPKLGLKPVAFVDDAPAKRTAKIRGVAVMGTCQDIPRVCRQTNARQVIVAMPSASGKKIREIVTACERAGISAKTIPALTELLGGTVSVKQLRDIKIEDLLRRDPVETDMADVRALIRGRTVMVTGGGGSIGSELCRQILRFEPKSLVILGHGENSVFEIHSELVRYLKQIQKTDMQNSGPQATKYPRPQVSSNGNGNGNGHEKIQTQLHTVIADIRFADRINAVFEEYAPDVVFHSAAHKHVPLMEVNPGEAITNNVLGTRNVLNAALVADVEHFVMISTDKAVNPTSVMGASKRVAELLVHNAARQSGKPYVAVRFGNVLGSRGSVVLSFRHQISAGGPVTVTHPEMKRYFMTIPEAVQLVLQAMPLGNGGEVFMLDMGEPVKIVDLAKDLIELSGMQVGRDIDIVFTGMRPGEKLFEEMFLPTEKYDRTRHEKIYIASNASNVLPANLDESIEELEVAAKANNPNTIIHCLQNIATEYEPARDAMQGNGYHPELQPVLKLEQGKKTSDRESPGQQKPSLSLEPEWRDSA